MINKTYLQNHAEHRTEYEDEPSHQVEGLSYIEKLKQRIEAEEIAIEAIVEQLPKAKLKTVIRIKYYERWHWDDIAFFIYGDEPDYCEDPERYKNKAQRMHTIALSHMKRIQEEKARQAK